MSTCPVSTGHQFNARGNCMHCFAKKPAEKQPKKTQTCEAFGSRCTICGSYFGDGGDDVCSYGHQIGEAYPTR